MQLAWNGILGFGSTGKSFLQVYSEYQIHLDDVGKWEWIPSIKSRKKICRFPFDDDDMMNKTEGKKKIKSLESLIGGYL